MAQCPQGVVPACHNAEDTVTVSGPKVRCPAYSDVFVFTDTTLTAHNQKTAVLQPCSYDAIFIFF